MAEIDRLWRLQPWLGAARELTGDFSLALWAARGILGEDPGLLGVTLAVGLATAAVVRPDGVWLNERFTPEYYL